MNATHVFRQMYADILYNGYRRQSSDPTSPAQSVMLEAEPGRSYTFAMDDVVEYSFDIKWATAYVLHFFLGTEEGEMLPRYNKNANRFLTDGRWIGAYGAIGLSGVRRCIQQLKESPDSRRAIFHMGDGDVQDINRPACWSFVQFLKTERAVDMLVYQRSLNLALMPYDHIVLSNIHAYVATALETYVGALRWTVGSLHMKEGFEPKPGKRIGSWRLPQYVRNSESACRRWLVYPEFVEEPFRTALLHEGELFA